MMRITTTWLVAFVMVSTSASAQQMTFEESSSRDFSRIRVQTGDTIFVSDKASRVSVSGIVKSISPGRIVVGEYEIEPRPGLKIEREGDTVWDGAAYGFLLGGLAGITIGSEACLNRSQAYCFLGGGITWGLLGAWIDSSHKGRTKVFLGAPDAAGRPLVRHADAADRAVDPDAALARPAADFTSLPVRAGARVVVQQSNGTETEGRVTSFDAHSIQLGAQAFDASNVTRIERVGDPIWDGAAIGAGVGALEAVATGASLRETAAAAGVYGAIGALIDGSMKRRTRVWGSVRSDALGRTSRRLVPSIVPRRHGLAVLVSVKSAPARRS